MQGIAPLPSTQSEHDFHKFGIHPNSVAPGFHFHLAASINPDTGEWTGFHLAASINPDTGEWTGFHLAASINPDTGEWTGVFRSSSQY